MVRVTKAPIVASHSGVYALRPHVRNLKDDQLKAIADSNGLVSLVMYRDFVKSMNDAYIKDFVDHIDYAVNLIGIDHVGIGSDFDGATIPDDIKNSSELYKITEELIKRKYKKEDIEKILGKNILRVLKEVENYAESKRSINMENDHNLSIIPELEMGEIILNSTPLLTANIKNINKTHIDELESRIIVDGISYKAVYDKKKSTLNLKIINPLKEKFHIVTFELWKDEENMERATRIFYVND